MARFESGIEFWHRRRAIEQMKEALRNTPQQPKKESAGKLTPEQLKTIWLGLQARYETPEQAQTRRDNYYKSRGAITQAGLCVSSPAEGSGFEVPVAPSL